MNQTYTNINGTVQINRTYTNINPTVQISIQPHTYKPNVPCKKIGTLSNRRCRPDDGNRKRDISFETSLRMYKRL